MVNVAVVELLIPSKHFIADLEIPLTIPADQVIAALSSTYALDMSPDSCLICENPIALVRGKKTLGDFGVHNGSVLRCKN